MSAPLVIPGEIDESGVVHLDIPAAQHRAACRARFAGQRVDVEIRPRKSKRSLRANAALHAGLHAWAGHHGLTGAAAQQWVEDAKDDLLALCFGYVVRQSQITGEVTKRLAKPHTSALTVEEFRELFDVAVVKAAEDGFLWTLPEELRKGRAA